MLHPGLGSSDDPLTAWQMDTVEADAVIGLDERHLSDAGDPEPFSRRLGMLWKKLATAPRLALLIVDYANLRLQSDEPHRRVGPRWVDRVLGALSRPASRPDTRRRSVWAEDDPLYDPWADR